MKKMSAHGEFSSRWHGRVLISNISGAFNLEGIEELLQNIRFHADMMEGSDWVRLDIINSRDTLGPLEAIPLIVKNFEYCASKGCRHIYRTGGENNILKEVIENVANEVSMPISFFESVTQAIDFIKAHTTYFKS